MTTDSQGRTIHHYDYIKSCNNLANAIISHVSTLINMLDSDGMTVLHQACATANVELVTLLLEQPNIDLTITDSYNRTPLQYVELLIQACCHSPEEYTNKYEEWNGKYHLIAALLTNDNDSIVSGDNIQELHNRNSRLNADQCDSLLHSAVSIDDSDTVSFILSNSLIPVNARNKYGDTPLHLAAETGHIEYVKLLLSMPDIDVNAQTVSELIPGRHTPLHYAVRGGHTECVKLLLAQPGINVNAKDKDGYTPLHYAMKNGNVECVKLLLEHQNINVNAQDKSGYTPLHLAAEKGHTECFKLLLDYNRIEINTTDRSGCTPLHLAAENGHSECIKLLLGMPGVDVNAPCRHDYRDDYTSLHLAAENGHTECVKVLLGHKDVNVNAQDEDGCTPLHFAVQNGHSECVKLLLGSKDINVNVQITDGYYKGYTPLHWAARNGKTECLKLLLAQKVIDVNVKDNEGKTPLAQAESVWNKDDKQEIISILKQHGATM